MSAISSIPSPLFEKHGLRIQTPFKNKKINILINEKKIYLI